MASQPPCLSSASCLGPLEKDVQLAADGTRKMVSVLTCGEGAGKKVETVIIPMLRCVYKKSLWGGLVCVSIYVRST